nr:MADS-box protein JOINTLESS-like [Ipomoea trifida]
MEVSPSIRKTPNQDGGEHDDEVYGSGDCLNDDRAASTFDSIKAQYHQLAKRSFEDEDYDECHLGESIQLCNRQENSLKVRLSKEISDKTLELRRISGEDLEGLSLEELEELEQKLEVGLNRVSETKDEQFRKEIATLQYKGAELMEENNWLKQRVANDRQNGRIVPDMDRMILDEGQTSESMTNNSTTQPPLQAAHCSDTLLKLGSYSHLLHNVFTTVCVSSSAIDEFRRTKQPEQAQQWHLKRCTPTRPNSATDGGCSRRKRTRNLNIVPFEGQECPSDVAVEGKQPKSKKPRAGCHGLSIVKSRASSPLYFDSVQKFNTAHREAVQEIEFGRFLELQIKVFPTELSYVLLNSYNPINSKLKLKDRLMVDIAEDDVSAILDFPRGIIEIERKKKKKGVSAPLSTKFKEKLQAKDGEKSHVSCVDQGNVGLQRWRGVVQTTFHGACMFNVHRDPAKWNCWDTSAILFGRCVEHSSYELLVLFCYERVDGDISRVVEGESSSWTKAVVKKWLNIPSAADEFQSDYTINSKYGRMNIVERRRKSCSNESGHAVVPDELSGEFLGGSLELLYDG